MKKRGNKINKILSSTLLVLSLLVFSSSVSKAIIQVEGDNYTVNGLLVTEDLRSQLLELNDLTINQNTNLQNLNFNADLLNIGAAAEGTILSVDANGNLIFVNSSSGTSTPPATINTQDIDNASITNRIIENNSITINKIADNSISEDKIKDNSIGTDDIANGSINEVHFTDNGVVLNTLLVNYSSPRTGPVNNSLSLLNAIEVIATEAANNTSTIANLIDSNNTNLNGFTVNGNANFQGSITVNGNVNAGAINGNVAAVPLAQNLSGAAGSPANGILFQLGTNVTNISASAGTDRSRALGLGGFNASNIPTWRRIGLIEQNRFTTQGENCRTVCARELGICQLAISNPSATCSSTDIGTRITCRCIEVSSGI